jgi:hypothetical protein
MLRMMQRERERDEHRTGKYRRIRTVKKEISRE